MSGWVSIDYQHILILVSEVSGTFNDEITGPWTHAVARYRCTAMMILRMEPLGRRAGSYARDGVSLLEISIPCADLLTLRESRAG